MRNLWKKLPLIMILAGLLVALAGCGKTEQVKECSLEDGVYKSEAKRS